MFGLGSQKNDLEVVISADSSQLNRELATAGAAVSSFETKVAGLGLAMTALATGGIVKSIGAAREWNTAVREMAKVTDPEMAARLGDEMVKLSRTIPLASEELAEIATAAARFGVVGEENIVNFTKTVAKMAAATELSVSEAGESFARLATLTGTPISEIENLGSTINMLGQTTSTSTRGVVNASVRSAAALRQLGMTADDILGLNAAVAAVSPNAEVAGSGLRRLATEMLDPRKIDDVASALGVTSDQFIRMRNDAPTETMLALARVMNEGGTEADILRETLSIFSQQTLLGLGSDLDATTATLKRSNEEYIRATSLARESQIEFESLGAKTQFLKSALDNTAATIGNVFIPHLKILVDDATRAVEAFNDWVDAGNGVYVAIGLVTAALAGLVPVVGLLAHTVGPVIPLIKGMGLAMLTLASGPVVLLAGAIGLLAAGITTNFAGMGDAAARVWEALTLAFDRISASAEALARTIAETIGPAFEEMGVTVPESIGEVVAAVTDVLVVGIETATDDIVAALDWLLVQWVIHEEEILASVDTIVTAIDTTLVPAIETGVATSGEALTTATGFWEEHKDGVLGALVALAEGVGNALAVIRDEHLTPFVRVAGELWAEHGAALLEETIETWTHIYETIQPALDALATLLDIWVAHAKSVWDEWGDELMAVTAFVWDAIATTIETVADGILTTIRVFLALIRGDWETAWTLTRDFFVDMFNGIVEFVGDWGGRFVARLTGVLNDAYQAFVSWAADLFTNSLIKDLFEGILSYISGLNFAGAVAGPLASMKSEVESKLAGVVGAFDSAMAAARSKASQIVGIAQNAAVSAANFLSSARGSASAAQSAAREGGDAALRAQSAARTARRNADAAQRNQDAALRRANTTIRNTSGGEGGDSRLRTTSSNITRSSMTERESDLASRLGFARGGLVTRPLHAMVGEAGPEAIIPLDTFFEKVLPSKSGGGTSIGPITIHADSYEGGQSAGRGLLDALRAENFD